MTHIKENELKGWKRKGPLEWAIIGGIAYIVAIILLTMMRVASDYLMFELWVFYLIAILVGSLIIITFVASYLTRDRGFHDSSERSEYVKEFHLKLSKSSRSGLEEEHPFFRDFEREFPQFGRYRDLRSDSNLHVFYRSKGRHRFELHLTYHQPSSLLRVQLSQDADDLMPPILLRRIELFIERYG